jgi:NAD-dependent deacetylase
MDVPEVLLERLAEADHVVVLTGAGVSAESGIKTFRDPDGLWAKLNPAELASVDGFMANPDMVWSWYQHRRNIINSTTPNPGHYAIAEMQYLFTKFTLITQNVDRLHQTAGSKIVHELHGNIIENHCYKCKEPFTDEIDYKSNTPPLCKACGGLIRPSVVWFGEMLPFETLKYAQEATAASDVFFSVGTSAEVYPAADLPMIALRNGAFVVEVNPNKTAISSYVHTRLKEPSGVALPLLIEKLKKLKNL